jgi:pyruvate,water dikinase
MREVGRTVGRLNKILPKRQFILVGPGRWGSRGDIKLGVPVTYSEINNTAMLIEIARKRGNYLPELSFGTHFFQDLVEASIRYLPLYPDDPTTVFKELFFRRSNNVLAQMLPEYAHLADTIHVIDVPSQTKGLVLKVLMNSDLDQAVGLLASPQQKLESPESERIVVDKAGSEHWRWRYRMAQKIAATLDPHRFGIKTLYLIGSTKNETAGPASDIDLMLHFQGNDEQKRDLMSWLEGWSLCLSEINFLRTGYRVDSLLDVHLVTDKNIAERDSFAVKIDAITDPVWKLPMKES